MCKGFSIAVLISFVIFVAFTFAEDPPAEEPPTEFQIASTVFPPPIPDGGYSELVLADPQPTHWADGLPVLYYLEMSEPTGMYIGAFGSYMNPHPQGDAYRDRELLFEGFLDLYLNYTPDGLALECLICQQGDNAAIALVNADTDPLNPHETLGQTFVAEQEFTTVALRTPTWVTMAGFTATLYRAKDSGFSVESVDKLAATWASLKKQ